MKRAAGLLVTLATMSGCVTTGAYNPGTGGGCQTCGGVPMPPALKGAVGPWGEPVSAIPPVGPHAKGAYGGMGPEVPFANPMMPGPNGPIMPANHVVGGPGMGPPAPGTQFIGGPGALPGMPGGMPMMPGMAGGMPPMPGMPGMPPMPGMPMPGMPGMPGAMAGGPPMPGPGGAMMPQGAVYAMGAMQAAQQAAAIQRSQVRFVGPAGAKIGWYVPAPAGTANGKPVMMPHQLDVPGRYNFIQASVYRVKLSDIPGRAGLELFPTIEVVPANPKTDAFLAHNYIPIEFTEEDFDQVTAGNFITKVIYLPDPQFQSAVAGGPEELVSTRLEPGVDPIAEAHRRGHILCVVRVGGIDLETAGTPPLDSPSPYSAPGAPVLPAAPGGQVPNPMPNCPPNQAMLQQMQQMQMQQMQQLPGIQPPMPAGMPGKPPMMPPPLPNFSAPTTGPAGPMVPPPAGGIPTSKAGSNDIQQTSYQLGADGKVRPVKSAPQRKPLFPQISIPGFDTMKATEGETEEAAPPAKTKSKGLFD